MLEACRVSNNWEYMGNMIPALCKKRGQSKQAISSLVAEATKLLDITPNYQVKMELLQVLRTATEGKIFLEVERAKLSQMLSQIREAEGNIKEATAIMHELQIETFGGLSKREKVEFLLEQMRLGILCQDFMKTEIISRKISSKFFQNEENQDLKLKYCQLMIQISLNEMKYHNCSQFYLEIAQIHEKKAERLLSLEVCFF